MEKAAVEEQLRIVQDALAHNQAERDVLESLIKGYKKWLSLNHISALAQQAGPSPVVVTPPSSALRVKGTISIREAVKQTLMEAAGEAVHARDLWAKAQEMGAITAAPDPVNITDLTAYSMAKRMPQLQKVGPRLWRWRQEQTDDQRQLRTLLYREPSPIRQGDR